MKGPGMRIELDVSRIWRCPQCSRQVRTRGNVTSRWCRCTGEPVWMDLVESIRQPRDFSGVIAGIHRELESERQTAAATALVPDSVEAAEGTAAGDGPPQSAEAAAEADRNTADSGESGAELSTGQSADTGTRDGNAEKVDGGPAPEAGTHDAGPAAGS